MNGSISVLHVDDEAEFAELTATFLEREDDRLEVETATSADQGLDLLEDTEYQCVVSDYDMPGRNGIEFLRRIRERWSDLPVILFTGKGNEEVASDAISAGVTDYLQKGSGTDQYELLANRVTNAVSKLRAERQAEEERRRFRTLFDRLSQPTVEVEYEADVPVVKRVNPAFEETFGYDADEIVGDSLDSYIVPEGDADEAKRINRHVRSGGLLNSEEVTRRTADGLRPFLIQNAVYDDGSGGFAIYSDISERREREAELERRRELLRQTEQLAGVGGWESDAERDELRWTRGTYDVHDLDPDGPFRPTIEAAIDFYHPDDRATIETALEDCYDAGEPYELDLRLITAENERKWVRASGEPVYDDDDEIVKLRGAIRDVTERKRREEELRRYERLVEYSPEILVVMNEDMTVEYQSPPSPLFEWDPLAITGDNPLEHVHPDDRDEILRQFERLNRSPGRISTAGFRAEDAAGDWRWIESRAQNFTDDDTIDGILVAMREITPRKRQERRLARHNASLEQLQATTRTLLETTDPEEAARKGLEAFESVLEFDIAGIWLSTEDRDALEPVAVSDRGRDLVSEPPTYTADARSLSWEAYRERELRYVSDVSARDDRFNEDTPIESEVIVPLGRHGLVNVGATEPDAFTEREIALIELWSDTLTVALARAAQLEVLREREAELTRERDRLDEFTGVVSHDLRSPLNVAKGRAELAATECDSEHLDDLMRALARMEELLEDSLALARRGQVVGETVPLELEEVATRSWRTVSTSDATLETVGTVPIRGDEDRLPEVFENLFANAIEHGGDSVTVTVGRLPDGFYVADDGPGIPTAERSRVLESGFTTSEDGSGFGLAIVEQICTAHGWEISVTVSETGGARFEVSGVELIE